MLAWSVQLHMILRTERRLQVIYSGQSVKRFEDPRLLTGQGVFLDDLKFQGMLHAAVLRSPHAHARITSIETAAALHSPGVVAVITADDLDGVVEFPRSIEGVRMALLFREVSQGRIKVSLRSVGDVDVAAFAKEFGGGGHTKAAGLALAGTLADVQATVLGAARAYLTADGGDGRSTS